MSAPASCAAEAQQPWPARSRVSYANHNLDITDLERARLFVNALLSHRRSHSSQARVLEVEFEQRAEVNVRAAAVASAAVTLKQRGPHTYLLFTT